MSSSKQKGVSSISPSEPRMPSDARNFTTMFSSSAYKDKDDPNFYLSDGNMTLAILQWDIAGYHGMDPQRTGHDHMGFKVESLDRIKEDLEDLTGQNPHMWIRALGCGSEGEARLELFQRCTLKQFHITDIEGVYIGISEN